MGFHQMLAIYLLHIRLTGGKAAWLVVSLITRFDFLPSRIENQQLQTFASQEIFNL
jgi:hypothetical protein